MPKTFTSDVQPAFPGAIEGPLTIVDAADASAGITINPNGAQISATGGARPTRQIHTSETTAYGSALNIAFTNIVAAKQITASSFGGYYSEPISIPPDMDVSQPMRVFCVIAPRDPATTNGQVMRMILSYGYFAFGEASTENLVLIDWSVPDDWSPSDTTKFLFDAGSGYTFPGGTFSVGDIVGFRVARDGSATEDTFDKRLILSKTLIVEYTSNRY